MRSGYFKIYHEYGVEAARAEVRMRIAVSELARVRQARGLSQRQLAALLGISASALSGVENLHHRAWPKLRAAAAEVLGVPERQLFPADEAPHAWLTPAPRSPGKSENAAAAPETPVRLTESGVEQPPTATEMREPALDGLKGSRGDERDECS
jgi:transcriptional regulator with XRE-family HTH domain